MKIKNVGYGMMHQKFCVIDRSLALHGSYNWSINAKNNNHESIIVTNHGETIQSLIDNFFNIKEKAIDQINKSSRIMDVMDSSNGEIEKLNEQNNLVSQTNKSNKSNFMDNGRTLIDVQAEYEKVLDSMIASEISNFDRPVLRKQGFDRAKSVNGDHNVISKALDSLYSIFINDINVVEDKKKRLLAKVEEQKTKSVEILGNNLHLQINTIESELTALKEELYSKIKNANSSILIKESEITSIITNKLPAIEKHNEELSNEIKSLEEEFVIPSFKWFEFIPVLFVTVGLLAYLIMFYSSAAYILLFSKTEAEAAKLIGATIPTSEVFNPKAISKASEREDSSLIFIFMFVFLPLAFATSGRFIKDKIASFIISFLVGILIVDSAIAYKVTESIHEVNYLSGKIDAVWSPTMVFKEPNFYLVFVLGAFGLLLFKFAFDKLIHIFEERSPDINHQKNQIRIRNIKETIDSNKLKLEDLYNQIDITKRDIIQLKTDVEISESEINLLPSKEANMIEKKKTEYEIKKRKIENVTDIYKSHIENDNLSVSLDSIKDRINIFLEGWDDYLHSQYSVPIAEEKTRQATGASANWLQDKVNNLDGRIKF